MTPVLALMVMPRGQAGGAVGERVAVGIGGVGVEADGGALGVARSVRSVLKTGARLVLVTVQVKVSVSAVDCRRTTVTVDVVGRRPRSVAACR